MDHCHVNLSEVPEVLLLVCACERVTSDFQGIARVENYVAKKKIVRLEVRFIIRLARLKNNN